MSRGSRGRNERLLAIIRTCGWSYDACVKAIRAVARETVDDLSSLHRSLVAYWVAGVRPSGLMPQYLAEAATRRLGWQVTYSDLGFGPDDGSQRVPADLDWEHDPVADLVTLGRADLERRDLAKNALYSLAALAVPLGDWHEIAERGRRARSKSGAVGKGEVEAVRHMTATFSQADERFGGGHARLAIVAYLTADVAGYLRGSFSNDEDRSAMFSAAAELTYLAGWQAKPTTALSAASSCEPWRTRPSTSGMVRHACGLPSPLWSGHARTPRTVRPRCSRSSKRVAMPLNVTSIGPPRPSAPPSSS